MHDNIVEHLRDNRQKFIFQGGSIYALNLAKEIETLREFKRLIEFHLNTDGDGDYFLTKESYKDLFEND